MRTLCLTPRRRAVTAFVGLVKQDLSWAKNIREQGVYPTPRDELQSPIHVHPRPIIQQGAYNEGTVGQTQICVAPRWI